MNAFNLHVTGFWIVNHNILPAMFDIKWRKSFVFYSISKSLLFFRGFIIFLSWASKLFIVVYIASDIDGPDIEIDAWFIHRM